MTTARETHHPIAEPTDVEMQLDSTFGVDPNPGTHTLIDRVLEVLCAALLAAITLILFANAVMRFAFNSPLGWTEELVTGMMLWLTMLGFTLGVRRRESIEIRHGGIRRGQLAGPFGSASIHPYSLHANGPRSHDIRMGFIAYKQDFRRIECQ